MADVLLDSSFLLPVLGYEVSEIRPNDVEKLRSASQSGKANLCCTHISFIEILGKVAKNKGRVDDQVVRDGIKSLLESGVYSWIYPSSDAINSAFDLRAKGHHDNIDNLLYSMALTSGGKMVFLSLDRALRSFLNRNGYDTRIIITPSDLDSL